MQKGDGKMIYIGIAGLILAVESAVKFLIETLGQEGKRVPIFKGKMFLTKCHNEGAFLNFGETKKVIVKYVSIILTAGAFLIFAVTLGRRGKRGLKLALSMLLGGAVSNTCDRMTRGYVVDYLGFDAKSKKLSNIIFNLSDFFIMAGALLSVSSVSEKKQEICKKQEVSIETEEISC